MTCKTCLLQSTIRTRHIRIGYVGRPDVIWRSSGCDVCECRVLLPKEVRIGEARHVSSWGNPDRNMCHVSSGNVRHASSGGGVPTMSPFLTCRFCLSRMGGLKIIVFETKVTFFALIGPRGERGQRERRAFMISRCLWVFPDSVSFQ